ncbi:hypothetical protein [Paenibacillus glycanilyticus]|uniref:DUF3139 domain-containing protein n=1 Tax=Paenibacillus glycanilyticus TaxID=126569 RepID=A0ABQ6GQ32_9BACL|nr:hypothetical protein [Paenibacillus glycanilyticus]GLX71137.1 hypothetical protein MU1_54860 [Paenibacillus glycanilyticus]
MKRFILSALSLLLLIVIFTFFSNRQDAQEYVTATAKDYMEADSSWGNFKIINTDRRENYVAVKIKYQTKADFVPPERWFIKDNVKTAQLESGYQQWEGNIYLIKKWYIRWLIIR